MKYNGGGNMSKEEYNTLKEEYLREEELGFKHTEEGHLIPKKDEFGEDILPAFWDEDWDLSIVGMEHLKDYIETEEGYSDLMECVHKNFVQDYTEDGVPIIHAAEDDDDDDDVWDNLS